MSVFAKWDEPRPVRLTVGDFLCLNDAGAFAAYAKTELIGGVVVAMNAQFRRHSHVQGWLFRRLAEAIERTHPDCETLIEVAVAIPPVDMPEPDIVVAATAPAGREAVPVETVRLVVEVSDTTAATDLGVKVRLYASAGIPEYWVTDLTGRVVHRLWHPDGDAYSYRDTVAFGDGLRSVMLAGIEIDTTGI